ncbi:MAG: hypothetical protein J7K45_00085, partial [Thaumarchaeota archaeon]|nr:hypothetical protein [Nitrososphaerota archaeon]
MPHPNPGLRRRPDTSLHPPPRRRAGAPSSPSPNRSSWELDGIVARRIYSARGRRELLPVYVVEDEGRYLVYDVGLGSGAVSSFGLSDGYITIPEEVELVEEGERVRVRLFGSELKPSELVIIGSHCVGIDLLLGLMDLRS